MARILIVGGGCPGRTLAALMIERGHAVRITTRSERGRSAIEQTGAECWIGTPDRLATMRGALDHVTIACWMLAGASGEAQELEALHCSRLEFFLSQAIDTTVRGFLYDATPGSAVPAALLADGAQIVRRMTELNVIPAVVLGEDGSPGASERDWTAAATSAVARLLGEDA